MLRNRLGCMAAITMQTPLKSALGDRISGQLKRAFGYTTVGQLIWHLPRRYALRGILTPISELPLGEPVTLVAEVVRSNSRSMQNRSGSVLEVEISDGVASLTLTFFNQAWRASQLQPGVRGIFAGKVTDYRGKLQLAHPDYELFEEQSESELLANAREWATRPVPLYSATSSLPSWRLAKLIEQLLSQLEFTAEIADGPWLREVQDLNLAEALKMAHQPSDEAETKRAEQALKAHEAFLMQCALVQQRREALRLPARGFSQRDGGLLAAFDAALGFDLTPDQLSVGAEISDDLAGNRAMMRLVQGEVGSGKTLVALRAILQIADHGAQTALIAPTEVLAGQHFRSISRMLPPDVSAELSPVLITASVPKAQRRRAELMCASGQAKLVIGTHALLSESTVFADLALVVIDEQHRFGVEQREVLRAKGVNPGLLVLTATPIPRTVAMTVFGDLDVSTIKTMPAGRGDVASFVVPSFDRGPWFVRSWQRIAEDAAAGKQAFVVCSRIDDSDDSVQLSDPYPQAQSEQLVKRPEPWSVVSVMKFLAEHPAYQSLTVAPLHGRMSADEKEQTMARFQSGEIDVLVCTTVIEVGVDVANANNMLITDADRFGVSQLHQLRGRVGRGADDGLCFLMTSAAPGSSSFSRLEDVAATRDGFELAELDLKLRGEGDVLASAQSGARSSLHALRVISDASLIQRARVFAESLFDNDPDLLRHPELARAIAGSFDEQARAALSKT